ncbi:MAG: RibD family protein [Candidatus Limnocylindria bacterium]
MTEPRFNIDRLWPDPAADLDLDEAMAGFSLPHAPAGRPLVGVNMITSIDGRAQLGGTAEGLGSRADRRLMQHYRAGYDAIGSGAGTLRQAGLWLRIAPDLAERRRRGGRPPQPTGILIGGEGPIPSDAAWFTRDEPRVLVVGAASPIDDAPPGTELLRAPTPRPEPAWVLAQLAQRGISSLLLEGGPHLNAAFLEAGLIDELYWTVGSHLLGTDALQMIAPIPGGSPFATEPRRGRLLSVMRHADELYLRYRFDGR